MYVDNGRRLLPPSSLCSHRSSDLEGQSTRQAKCCLLTTTIIAKLLRPIYIDEHLRSMDRLHLLPVAHDLLTQIIEKAIVKPINLRYVQTIIVDFPAPLLLPFSHHIYCLSRGLRVEIIHDDYLIVS
jgi:hypothetical protein